jgi:hypothetical protein
MDRIVIARHHAASSTFTMLPGGIALVKYGGPMTADCLKALAKNAIAVNDEIVQGFINDYTEALILCNEDDWWRAVRPLHRGMARSMVGAYVGGPTNRDLLDGHALNMVAHGYIRTVHPTVEQAHAWLLGKVPCRK